MNIRARYLSAICINVLLPWLAYHLAYPQWGHLGALAASTLPLIAWMTWDLLRFSHFDALSAIVLVGTLFSLVVSFFIDNPHTRLFEEPIISGLIGIAFLISLAFAKPIVFYLGRSTIAREQDGGTAKFDQWWRDNPDLVAAIRKMTLVWGAGLTAENAVRLLLNIEWEDAAWIGSVSTILRYATYGVLMLWTFLERRRIRRMSPSALPAK
ncbi:hypothetical protein SBC1_60000 (plasmid) [Caballeronia sp. SBC1]|uniref:VC0807 family protein n=1 Tax=unclassified Caballeronia TaxID=2646786 RepID=UPI0013E19CF3|nr:MULTISPECIES: VC0807 family protein [unclassified Caballeronia]QIE27889.1 hypothetical protein SBC2_59640 [Caballeronia sp. SBC2]QIN65954.1 hypothetical protein SBC1_60000 [Caballeronia sp. SBC1]